MKKKIVAYLEIKNGPVRRIYSDLELSDHSVLFKWSGRGWLLFDACLINYFINLYSLGGIGMIEFLLITDDGKLCCHFQAENNTCLEFGPEKTVEFNDLMLYAYEVSVKSPSCCRCNN